MNKLSIPLGISVAITAILAYMIHAGVSFQDAVNYFSGTFIFTLLGVLVAFSALVSIVVSVFSGDSASDILREI